MSTEAGEPNSTSVLTSYLRETHDHCPVCEYDLFGVSEAVCPECGSPIHLGVVSPNARMGPWLLAVISFALAVGFDGVVVLLMFVPMIAQGVPAFSAAPLFWVLYLMMLILGIGSGIGLWFVLQRRRWWQCRPAKSQWRRGWLVFVSVGATHALVSLGVVLFLAA